MTELWDWVKVLVSPVVTFIAFFFTYQMNKKQNMLTQNKIDAQSRIAILPFLNVEAWGTGFSRQETVDLRNLKIKPKVNLLQKPSGHININFGFKNIGQATAVSVKLLFENAVVKELGNISKDEKIGLLFDASHPINEDIEFKIQFSDIGGNQYVQIFNTCQIEQSNGYTLCIKSFSSRPA